MVIGKPSTDPFGRSHSCESSQAFALLVGFVDSAVKSLKRLASRLR